MCAIRNGIFSGQTLAGLPVCFSQIIIKFIVLFLTPKLTAMKALVLLIASAAISPTLFSQATGDYRSKATGNWNAASSWETFNGTSWVNAATPPSSTDGVITLTAGYTITNTTSITVDQLVVNGVLVQNSTMNIANGAGDDITINGTVEFRGTATTIQANAVCAINSVEIKLFSTVTNNGIVNWNSGYFSFDGGSFINNNNFNAASNSYMA